MGSASRSSTCFATKHVEHVKRAREHAGLGPGDVATVIDAQRRCRVGEPELADAAEPQARAGSWK